MDEETFVAAMELKLADTSAGGQPGELEGYGAVFGNEDSHGDVILPGAFASALAQHKSAGTMPTMYVEHGPVLGGSTLPDGVWTEMVEDKKGLRVKGRISALDTDHGRRIRALVGDGALKGLSIGYRVGAGNAIIGKKAGEPRRQIKALDRLFEVSLVTAPSNSRAQVDSIKTVLALADKEKAAHAVASALLLHRSSMAGGDSPTAAERTGLLTHLMDAHEAITGKRMPEGMKAMPANVEELKMELKGFGFSEQQAADIAAMRFATTPPVGGKGQGNIAATLVAELGGLSGFNLPTLR